MTKYAGTLIIVFPAQVRIHPARSTFKVSSDIGRYRQSVDPGSAPGMTGFLSAGGATHLPTLCARGDPTTCASSTGQKGQQPVGKAPIGRAHQRHA